YVTSTGSDGNFRIDVNDLARYVLRADFPAFSAVSRDVEISVEKPNARIEISMVLLSRAEKPAQAQARGPRLGAAAAGMQQLVLSGIGENETSSTTGEPSSLTSVELPNAGLA